MLSLRTRSLRSDLFMTLILATGWLFSIAPPARASSVLRDFNLIVLGDLNNVSAVEGRAFVGGKLNAKLSPTFGSKLTSTDRAHNPAALVVGGNIDQKKNKEQYKLYGDLF